MMKKTQMNKMERLQSVLDSYGADTARWPSQELELSVFVTENTQAAQLYQQTQALDQLLDLSVFSPSRPMDKYEHLQQSILADFADMHTGIADVVVPFDGRKPRAMIAANNDNSWMTAAALAACFAFGIYLGGTGIGDWSLDIATNLAGLASEGDQFAAFADAIMPSSFEEELL